MNCYSTLLAKYCPGMTCCGTLLAIYFPGRLAMVLHWSCTALGDLLWHCTCYILPWMSFYSALLAIYCLGCLGLVLCRLYNALVVCYGTVMAIYFNGWLCMVLHVSYTVLIVWLLYSTRHILSWKFCYGTILAIYCHWWLGKESHSYGIIVLFWDADNCFPSVRGQGH